MKKKFSKAFTLAELLVSVAIVSLIMTTVLFNYSVFNDNLALSAAAQEVSVAMREAQTYGLTVKEVSAGGGQFTSGYGIYFDLSNAGSYIVFVDTNNNQRYDVGSGCGSGSTECVEKFDLRNGVTISNLCSGGVCPPNAQTKMLHITFLRPNPNAQINFTNNGNQFVFGPATDGKVILISPKGKTTGVEMQSSGQISIN